MGIGRGESTVGGVSTDGASTKRSFRSVGNVIRGLARLKKKKEEGEVNKKEEVSDEERQRNIDLRRFERKKRKISQRMQTVKELEALRHTVGAQLGGQWIDQKWVPTAALEMQNMETFSTKDFIIEILLYLTFLAAFTWLVYSGRSNRELVMYEKLWRNVVEARFSSVRTPDAIFEGLRGLLLHDLDNATQTRAYLDGYLAPNVPAGILGSAPIGEVRLRQLRSSGGEDSCSRTHKAFVLQGLARNGTGCYPRWGAVDEETVYTKANKVPGRAGKKEWYSYWSFLDTAVIPTLGRYGLYYGGGFVAKWPFVESHEHVALVEESHWIDTKTRVVFLDFAFFNPDLALFLSTEVLFEFPGHGAVEPRLAVQSISLIRYPVNGIGDIVRIGVVCFVYLMVVYYILDDVEYCRKKGLAKYASFGWPHVDVINVCLFVISGVWKLANQILVLLAIPKESADEALLSRIRATAVSLQSEDYIIGFNGLLLWIKLFKYISITGSLVRVQKAMVKSVKDIASFAVLFVVVLFAFAILGFLLVGNQIWSFSTMNGSITTIVRAMYGDVDFQAVVDAAGIWGFLYLIGWLIVSTSILLNLVIAIMIEVFRVVQEEEQMRPTPTRLEQILDDLKKRREEWEELRHEYDQKNPDLAAEFKKPGTFMTLVFRVWTMLNKRSERRAAAAAALLAADEEEDEEVEEKEGAGAKPLSDKFGPIPQSGEWKPWPSRVAPSQDDLARQALHK